jgi:hypothetical protein
VDMVGCPHVVEDAQAVPLLRLEKPIQLTPSITCKLIWARISSGFETV